jgi:hypothetical protein
MALLDHFHPPLSTEFPWHSVHNGWSYNLAASLNQRLPVHCHAISNVQFGIEVDVATLDRSGRADQLREVTTAPCLAQVMVPERNVETFTEPWTPPPPTGVIPFETAPETVEVLIYSSVASPTLVGAIELVSPANKDRPAQRQAFVAKCESLLRQGVGLVVVDIVTSRKANLHDDLLQRLVRPALSTASPDPYAAAYHPVRDDEQPALETWCAEVIVGKPLPLMPLWLRGELCTPVLLNSTYHKTCADLRIITITHD